MWMHSEGEDTHKFRILSRWHLETVPLDIGPEAMMEIITKSPSLDATWYFQGIPGPIPFMETEGVDQITQIVPGHFYIDVYVIKDQKVICGIDIQGFKVWWRRNFYDDWELLPGY